MCPFVKGLGNVSETFLSCGVPDVKRDLTVVDLYAFDFEVDPNCAEVVGLEGIFAVTHQ